MSLPRAWLGALQVRSAPVFQVRSEKLYSGLYRCVTGAFLVRSRCVTGAGANMLMSYRVRYRCAPGPGAHLCSWCAPVFLVRTCILVRYKFVFLVSPNILEVIHYISNKNYIWRFQTFILSTPSEN